MKIHNTYFLMQVKKKKNQKKYYLKVLGFLVMYIINFKLYI